MTTELNDLLATRAERARAPRLPDDVATDVADRAANRARRRRNRYTIASGTALVAAAATVGTAIAAAGGGGGPADHHGSAHQQAAGPARVAVHAPAAGDPTLLPVLVPLASGTSQTLQRDLAEARARARAAVRAAAAARLARKSAQAGGGLQPVGATPDRAEISIGLLPIGNQYPYTYLGHDDAEVWYGPAGGSSTEPDFTADIVLDVHQFIGQAKDYTLTVDGRPASYGTSGGYTTVRVRYSKGVDVGFQVPPNSAPTQAQALKMASTIVVRRTKHRTHG